jgi:hypothetical protein
VSGVGRSRRFYWVLGVNTVLCLLLVVPAFLIQMGAVMGGAAEGAGDRGILVAIAGFFLPAMPIASIAGSWATVRWRRIALAFVWLPWLYLAALGVGFAMLAMR